GGALGRDRDRGGDAGLLHRAGERGRRGRRVDRAVGQGGLLIRGGEVGDLDVGEGEPVLLEHRREQVPAGRAGAAGDADGAALAVRDGRDGAVVQERLADLERGRGDLRIARGDAQRADDLEGQALVQGGEYAGSHAGEDNVELVVGEHRDAVLPGVQRGERDGDAGVLEAAHRVGDVQRREEGRGHVAHAHGAGGAAAGVGVLAGHGGAAGGEGAAERGGGGE